jgi:serine/threonine-protein kinase haspin
VKKSTSKCLPSRVAMDDTRFGVNVTIIDLGLSRMSAADAHGSKIYWTPFDNEIFEGEGELVSRFNHGAAANAHV